MEKKKNDGVNLSVREEEEDKVGAERATAA